MTIWRSWKGMLTVHLTSADPTGALQAIRRSGITLWNVTMLGEYTWEFTLDRIDHKRLLHLTQKRGENCVTIKKFGFYWTMLEFLKRPVLIFGIIMLLVLSLWVPSRIFFVQVTGNISIPDRQIIEYAKECGIIFGASRRQVRSEQVKNKLLAGMPQLQWAGINTSGCVAYIYVRERIPEHEETQSNGVCSIVASSDAVITEITVRKGNGLCKPGQAVKSGQVLISGYTDCGICIQAVHAEGEIIGLTQRTLTVLFPLDRLKKTDAYASEKKYSLIIGKKQINLSQDSGILGMTCDKIYEQKSITLPGGFCLPISLVCETLIYYHTEETEATASEKQISDFAQQYVLAGTIAGTLQYSQEYITFTNRCAKLDGIYGCLENIGLVRMEESIPDYGKSN